MVLRLVLGILAATFVPLGIAFVVVGLAVDEPDRGEPEAFLYLGAPLAAVGLGFAITFVVLQRREAQRRRRRREGLRATVEVVSARLNPRVRSGGSVAMHLVVLFPTAGTPDGTISGTFLVIPSRCPAEGSTIEILYDPADPSNFEPAT